MISNSILLRWDYLLLPPAALIESAPPERRCTIYNRIKKSVTNGPVTRTFFPGYYEEEVSGSTTTIIKHYSFNGQIIATRRKVGTDDVLRYTHTDHLGSSSGQTDANGYAVTYLRYHAYGTVHEGNPAHLNTDRTFTGQKQDSTGLLYYNARYYDPTLGQFLSPDTLVPDAGVSPDNKNRPAEKVFPGWAQ